MWLIFIDETSDSKFKDYFGLSCVVVNSTFYSNIKREFQKILLDYGWNPEIEFKGSYLFSATKGCTDISVEKRIEIASKVLKLNTAKRNARMSFVYIKMNSINKKDDYLKYVPVLINKALKKAKKKHDKDLVSLNFDFRSDIKKEELFKAIYPVIVKKGYVFLEDIHVLSSNFETVGILYADIVGYLFAKIDNISNDADLFENIPPEEFERNGKIKKLKSSIELIKVIKNFDRYQVVL